MSSVIYEMIALTFLKQHYLIKQPHSTYDNTEDTETRSFFILAVRVEVFFFFWVEIKIFQKEYQELWNAKL